MKNVNIAMCQIFCLDGDRSGNLVRIENALADASQSNADIVCLPETAILGWVNRAAHQRAFEIPGQDTDRLTELAIKYKKHLCVGLAEKEGDKLYDSVLLIDDTGKIILKHRKMNILTELMTPPYTPGKDVGVTETKFGAVGMLICADTFRDDALEKMAALKPEIVLIPYGWAAPEGNWPDHGKSLHKTVSNAAKRIGAHVIGTDGVGEITQGPWKGYVYGGQSVACDKTGKIIAIAADRDRDIKIVTVK